MSSEFKVGSVFRDKFDRSNTKEYEVIEETRLMSYPPGYKVWRAQSIGTGERPFDVSEYDMEFVREKA